MLMVFRVNGIPISTKSLLFSFQPIFLSLSLSTAGCRLLPSMKGVGNKSPRLPEGLVTRNQILAGSSPGLLLRRLVFSLSANQSISSLNFDFLRSKTYGCETQGGRVHTYIRIDLWIFVIGGEFLFNHSLLFITIHEQK